MESFNERPPIAVHLRRGAPGSSDVAAHIDVKCPLHSEWAHFHTLYRATSRIFPSGGRLTFHIMGKSVILTSSSDISIEFTSESAAEHSKIARLYLPVHIYRAFRQALGGRHSALMRDGGTYGG